MASAAVTGSLRVARAMRDAHVLEEKEIRQQTRALRTQLSKCISATSSLFRTMDVDGNGLVSRQEFGDTIAALGLTAQPAVVDALFDDFDLDGSGEISYAEYVCYALRDKLKKESSRVMDVFKKFDADGSGEIDKAEFRKAINAMGWEASWDVYLLDEVFDTIDTDGSGTLSFQEMSKQLRSGLMMKKSLSSSLQPGMKGEIHTKGKNKHALRATLEEQFLINVKAVGQSMGTSKRQDEARAETASRGVGGSGRASPRGGGGPANSGGRDSPSPRLSPTALIERHLPAITSPRLSPVPMITLSSGNTSPATSPRPRSPSIGSPAVLSPRSGLWSAATTGAGMNGGRPLSPEMSLSTRTTTPRRPATLHPKEFVNTTPSNARSIQDEKVLSAKQTSAFRNGPATTQFYKNRICAVFHSPRWEQPFPSIDDEDGTPVYVRFGGGAPIRADPLPKQLPHAVGWVGGGEGVTGEGKRRVDECVR